MSVFLFCPKPTFLLLRADGKLAEWVIGKGNSIVLKPAYPVMERTRKVERL